MGDPQNCSALPTADHDCNFQDVKYVLHKSIKLQDSGILAPARPLSYNLTAVMILACGMVLASVLVLPCVV